jgi:membrane protein YdbS with pleckstrin-like domain
MAYPRKNLVAGEELVLDLRPHPVALAIPALVTLAVVIVGIWLIVTLNGTLKLVVLAGIALALIVYPIRRLTAWLTSYFVVTSDRVIQREGWIARQSIEIPLEQINDIRFTQGIFERMIGAGDLMIRSASNDGPTTFEDIRHPEEVQKTIYHQGELNNQRIHQGRPVSQAAPAAAPAPPINPGVPNVSTELERLADLRAKGILTEEEFEAQKAKILGRS